MCCFSGKPSEGKTYEEWLSDHPTETQQKYWVRRGINCGEAGLVSLADMIGGNSEPLTIDDLRAL